MTKKILNLLILNIVIVLLSGCDSLSTTTHQSIPPVRLGYFPNVTHAVPLVGVAQGKFVEALGDQATLEVKTFNAGPALIEAIFAGEIDMGYIGPNPAINGYVKSGGEALRIIAGACSGGASFIVRPAANIKSPADLAGKRLATPQLGNTQDVALRAYLKAHGLETADKGGSVELIPTQNPDILTLFQQGQIDGAWVPEPWATRLIQEGQGEPFLDERTLWPGGQFVTTHLIVNTNFLQQQPTLVQAILSAHIDTVAFINNHPTESQQIINQEIERITTKGMPVRLLDTAFNNVTITYDPLPQSLFKSADDAFKLGFLGETPPDLGNIYALDLLNELLIEKGLTPINLSPQEARK